MVEPLRRFRAGAGVPSAAERFLLEMLVFRGGSAEVPEYGGDPAGEGIGSGVDAILMVCINNH